MPLPKKHLLLMIDINKSILMFDNGSKKTPEMVLNEIVSDMSYGHKVGNGDYDWEWDCENPKILDHYKQTNNPIYPRPLSTYSYHDHTKESCQELEDLDDAIGKRHRDSLRSHFTLKSNPGHGLKYVVDMLANKLKEDEIDGYHSKRGTNIIPAFFFLLRELKLNNVEFSLQFRTFGRDSGVVINEFNQFCEGRHPICKKFSFPVFDGSDNLPDLRALSNPAVFSRTNGTNFILTDGRELMGDEAIEEWTRQTCLAKKTVTIIDDWRWWKLNKETADCGKLVYLCKSIDPLIHPLLLDDNIYHETARVAQVMDMNNKKKIDFSESKNKYLARLEPSLAILHHDYFLKLAQACTQCFTSGQFKIN